MSYQLPYKPTDPEYIAWEFCDAEHAMENLCSRCLALAKRIREAVIDQPGRQA